MFDGKKSLLFPLLLLLPPACFALGAPVVTSQSNPNGVWSNAPEISLNWPAIEGATAYCYTLDQSQDAVPTACENRISVSYQKSDGVYYFRIKAKNASGEESAITAYEVKVDRTEPEQVKLTATAKQDGSIELMWDVAVDSGSGSDKYEIYRSGWMNFNIRDAGSIKIATVTGASYTDSNDLEQSITYHYRVRPVDKAGNYGMPSNEAIAETAAKCDLEVSFTVDYSSDKKKLLLHVASNDSIYHGALVVLLPGGGSQTFFSEKPAFMAWDGELDLADVKEGNIDFNLTAREYITQDNCDQGKRFVYDVTNPVVKFVAPKFNEKVSEIVPLQAEAADPGEFNSGVKDVVFFIKDSGEWRLAGLGGKKEGAIYQLDWNSFSVVNAQQEFKAVVSDNAGNSAEKTHSIVVLNAFSSSVDLNGAIAEAWAKKESALAFRRELLARAIKSAAVDSLLGQADANLAAAVELSKKQTPEDETKAKLLFSQAISLYDAAKSAVSTSDYKSGVFIFNREQTVILLNAAGYSGAVATEAKQLVDRLEPKRELKLIKVVDDNAEYYKAVIVVSFSLDVNLMKDKNAGDPVLQAIEVVPKQFAEYAKEIDSNFQFTVLNDDPVLSFVLTKQQYKVKSFEYVLKEDLSQQKADKMMEENIVNKFVAPPVLLLPGSRVGAGLFGGISLDILLFAVVGVVAIILVALLALFFVRKRKHGGGSPMSAAIAQPKKRFFNFPNFLKKK